MVKNIDHSINHCIDKIPYNQLLSEEETELIKKNSNVVIYKKKEIIFRQNSRTSHIMLVLSGFVKIFKEGRNERVIILKISKSGDYIGMLSILGDQVHQYSASAIEDSEICYIDINVFKSIILDNGRYSLQVMNLISRDGLFIFERLLSQSQKQLPGRIADVLLYFTNEIYQSSSFSLPLTRRELAEFAGTTKESFIRTLTEFRNDKIINLTGSDVEIVSMDIVKTLSELG